MKQRTKIFSERQVRLLSFLCGPLMTIYVITHNLTILGKKEEAKNARIIGIIYFVLIIIFAITTINIDTRIIDIIIPFLSSIIARKYAFTDHKEDIEKHIENGGSYYGGWKATGMGLLGIIVYMITAVGIIGLYQYVTDPYTYEEYGDNRDHLIIFDKENIPSDQIDKIAKIMKSIGFMGDNNNQSMYIYNSGDNYIINIDSYKESIIEDMSGAYSSLNFLQDTIQHEFTGKNIILNAIDNDNSLRDDSSLIEGNPIIISVN